jgi:hypothetical protein
VADVEADLPRGRLVPTVFAGFLGAICKTTRKFQHIALKELEQAWNKTLKIQKF